MLASGRALADRVFLLHGRASQLIDARRLGAFHGAGRFCRGPGSVVSLGFVRRTMAGWFRHCGGSAVPEAPSVISDGRRSTMRLLWVSAHPQPTDRQSVWKGTSVE